jgi:hypothetical protein
MSGIECGAIRGRFLALEEGTLPAEKAAVVRAHVAACDACRRAWDEWRAEDGRLREALRPVPAPRDVASAVLARIRSGEQPRAVVPRRFVLAWGIAAAAAVALLALGALLLLEKRYERVGQVASIAGQPMARQKGARSPSAVAVGSPIYDGDALLAGEGSELVVELDDGSLLDLSQRTEAQLHGPSSGDECDHHFRHVCLHQGSVEFDVRSTQRFEGVGTPLGSVFVHGTKFKVRYVKDKRTVLDVLEGEVRFSCPGGEVVAEAGTQWVIEAGQRVPRRMPGVPLSDSNVE